jgi:hypothetical protein
MVIAKKEQEDEVLASCRFVGFPWKEGPATSLSACQQYKILFYPQPSKIK